MLAAFRPPMFAMDQCRESIHAWFRHNEYAAAVAAVAAVRPAARHVFFAAKTHTAVSAAARFNFDMDAVDEHAGGGGNTGF